MTPCFASTGKSPFVASPSTLTPRRFLKPPSKSPAWPQRTVLCSQNNQPDILNKPLEIDINTQNQFLIIPELVSVRKSKKCRGNGEKKSVSRVGSERMSTLCGFGYWVNGFRCFPWLALNFHMAHHLNLAPATLQLVQNIGSLPMVAKPLHGVLSDAVYIAGAHRLPYISAGVVLQILSWGPLALIPAAREALPNLMLCILLSNLGASTSEVAMDALVAEYGQRHNLSGLQSYAFMASAAGGILGNLMGGYILMKTPPSMIFLYFAALLTVKFTLSSLTKEASLGVSWLSKHSVKRKSILESIGDQASDLATALCESRISQPLIWIFVSIATVPLLSGSIFCYQTQCLNLNPSVIGMSRVIGQLLLLFTSLLFDRHLKYVPMRKLIGIVQGLYACSLLLDFVLVRQINLRLGIPNEVFALCFSGLAETIAQFKLLPFSVLFVNLCPKGCEGSLTSFLASSLCLSSIVSGFLGVGLASLIGITSGDYSRLPMGIIMQFVVAVLPLGSIWLVPASQSIVEKERKRVSSKRTRKNRKVGRVTFKSIIAYRCETES